MINKGEAMQTAENWVSSTQDEIQIAQFADLTESGFLTAKEGERPFKMCHSDGTGLPLLKLGKFGADVIRFAANEGVANHTHEGDHMLFVIKGTGFVEYNGTDHALHPGVCYLIPGHVDHAVKATTELVLIAVGNNHFPVDSEQRLEPIRN
jgi:quercetin dioxygenase-like cupin family protein